MVQALLLANKILEMRLIEPVSEVDRERGMFVEHILYMYTVRPSTHNIVVASADVEQEMFRELQDSNKRSAEPSLESFEEF